jgi:hypothetical protein
MFGALIWGRISAMQQALHRSSLVPRGFVVESAHYEGDKAIIAVRASGSVGLCPSCGTVSRRVHSRYLRRVTDLPLSGRIPGGGGPSGTNPACLYLPSCAPGAPSNPRAANRPPQAPTVFEFPSPLILSREEEGKSATEAEEEEDERITKVIEQVEVFTNPASVGSSFVEKYFEHYRVGKWAAIGGKHLEDVGLFFASAKFILHPSLKTVPLQRL